MSESIELFKEINYIKNKVDALEKIQLLGLRTDSNAKKYYTDKLLSDEELFDVYKAIDGSKNQQEIANAIGKSNATVTKKIKLLRDELGLIEIIEVISKSCIYKHTVAEKAFKLTQVK